MSQVNHSFRHKSIVSIVSLGSLILIGYLFSHQILHTDYSDRAQNRTLIKRTIAAPRGNIYDRNEKLLVVNEPTYELEMIYREVEKDMDVSSFCDLLEISESEFDELIQKARSKSYYRNYLPITFLSNIDPLAFAKFQEHLFRYPGFYPKLKNKRSYPYPHAAHVLGYISEVTQKDIERNEVYTIGDIKGTSGLEGIYESELRGEKGLEYLLKDNIGREVDSYKKGQLDKAALPGKGYHFYLGH